MEKPGFSAWILLFETRAYFHNENLEKKVFLWIIGRSNYRIAGSNLERLNYFKLTYIFCIPER